jgi:hypothetical protein
MVAQGPEKAGDDFFASMRESLGRNFARNPTDGWYSRISRGQASGFSVSQMACFTS